MPHTDKFDRELKKGDIVDLVYGGDRHSAQVTDLTNLHDVPHLALHLTSPVSVPAASVAKSADKQGKPTPPPAPPVEPDRPRSEPDQAGNEPTVLAQIAEDHHDDPAARKDRAEQHRAAHAQSKTVAHKREQTAKNAVATAKKAK